MRTRNEDKVALVKQKAMELVVKHGLEGFSVNKLAKACDISVATLYIYYKDKDDLLMQIAREEAKRMTDIILKGFDPEVSFEEGLRMQWKNRAKHMMQNPIAVHFFEQLRTSTYQEVIFELVAGQFKDKMGKFMKNVIARGEIDEMPIEVYWSVAFAPLYNLVRFENEGKSMGNKKFKLTDKMLWQTFDLVIKALKK